MTARQVATAFACMLLMGLLAACSNNVPPAEDATVSENGRTNVELDTSGTVLTDVDYVAHNEDGATARDEFGEFEAAGPLSDELMQPFASLGDQPVERTPDVSDRDVAVRPDEEDLGELFAMEAVAALPPVRGASAEIVGDLFREQADAAEPRLEPATGDDEFAAAPPVAIADAVDPNRNAEKAERPAAATAGVPYWPRFHGPQGDNKSADVGLLKKWPDNGPPLVWTATGIGFGYSGISTADGLIFTAGNKDERTVISAIDLGGNIKWQVENGAAWTASFEGTRGTPTIDGDRIYHQSPVGNILCLKAESGDRVWEANCLEKFGGKNITWALSESLLIDGDRLICCPGGNQASVAALNKMTGETIWKAESTGDKAGYSTPTLAEHNGQRMIFVMTSKSVIGVNADTGKLLFRHPFKTQYDVNVLKPIFHDGHLFVSGGYGTTGSQLLKLDVNGDDVSVSLVWESKDLDNHHGGVMLLDGFLYGAAHKFSNAKWICLDWASGELKWAERGIGKGSVTFADDMLYMMSEKSQVGLAKPTPDGHEVVSKFRLPPGGSGSSWAHPVVSGGRLYLRHADRLFAYDVRAGQ